MALFMNMRLFSYSTVTTTVFLLKDTVRSHPQDKNVTLPYVKNLGLRPNDAKFGRCLGSETPPPPNN